MNCWNLEQKALSVCIRCVNELNSLIQFQWPLIYGVLHVPSRQ